MQKLVREYLDELNKRQKKNRKVGIAVLLLAVIVVGSIMGILTQYGIAMTGGPKCGLEEHVHGEDCYKKELTCGREEGEGHTHTEECRPEKELTCGQEEGEGHTHTEECRPEKELTCGQEESEGHTHTESCMAEDGSIICGQEESEGHTHTESCYSVPEGYICGQEESEGHTHTESCYSVPEGYICGLEEGGEHTHTDACYAEELVCEKKEHTHTDECYIDASADLENQTAWDAQYAEVEWKGSWGEDLVTAARMQLGYRESTDNYIVAEDKSHKGYTRYGQFAGDPYADWDAAFVNFCIHYAGLGQSGLFPTEADSTKWQEEFGKIREENAAYLTVPAGYEPKAGDIVFLQKENEETAAQMAIVTSYDGETEVITAIEGNSGNEVRENSCPVSEGYVAAYLKLSELENDYKNTGANEAGIEAVDAAPDSDIPDWVADIPVGGGSLTLELRYGDKARHDEKPDGSADRAHHKMVGYYEIGSKDIANGVGDMTVTIHIPKEYIDKNSIGFDPIPQDQFPHEVLGVVENGDYYDLGIKFLDYKQTGQIQYEFHMNFIGGIVPEDYELKIYATIEAGEQQDNTGENIYRPTYEKPWIVKYVNTNQYDNMSRDYTKVSAQIDDNNEIKEGEYVSFWYKIGGDAWYIREYDTITLTDTLPTYIDKDGKKQTAVFDAEANPGWTLGADGNVSYTVTTDKSCSTRKEGEQHWVAALDLRDQIEKAELKLRFPGCKIDELLIEDGKDTGFLKKDLLNKVNADFHPHNPSEGEKNDTDDDDLWFTLTSQPVGAGFTKYNSSNVIMDTHTMRSNLYRWGIRFENSESTIPFEHIVVQDYALDDRLKICKLRLETENKDSLKAAARIAYVEAIRYDGTEDRYEPSEFSNGAYEYGWGWYQELVLNPEYEYKEFYIHMKDEYQLALGQSIHVGVYTTFRNPERKHYVSEGDTTADGSETTSRNKYVNKAHVEYQQVQGSNTIFYYIDSENSFLLIDTNENIKIVKESLFGDVVLGKKDKPWILTVQGALRDGKSYQDMRIVDLLPESFTFNRIENGKEYVTRVETKENYKNSGRNAVILYLDADEIKKVLDASDGEKGKIQITCYTDVPEDASVGSFTNKAYLLSDDFEEVTTQPSEADRYDLDQDGDQTDLIRKSEASCIVKAPTGVYAEKFIAPAGSEAWRKNVDLFLGVEDLFQYKLSVVNAADTEHKGLVVYDVLPKIGDPNISASAQRGSEYTVHLHGPITPPDGYDVYYTTSQDVYSKKMDEMIKADIWMQQIEAANKGWDQITAFKFVAREGTVIPAKLRQEFIIPVKVTDQVSEQSYEILEGKESTEQTSGSTTSLRATNSFGYQVDSFSGSNLESNYVSAQILFAGFTIKKVDATETEKALSGAEFILEKRMQQADPDAGTEEVWKPTGKSGTSSADGKISFKHLTEGVYRLIETKAPEGYSLSSAPIQVEITQNRDTMEYTVAIEGNDHAGNNEDPFLITNHMGYELPSTGGSGIYWYSIGGILLMMAGALILYKIKCKEVLGG